MLVRQTFINTTQNNFLNKRFHVSVEMFLYCQSAKFECENWKKISEISPGCTFVWLSSSGVGFFIDNSKKTRFYCEKTGFFCQSQWVFLKMYGRNPILGFFTRFLNRVFFSLTKKLKKPGFFVVDFFELIGRFYFLKTF
jgi:hypothetical protein